MGVSSDATWQLDGLQLGGKVLRPDGYGPFPAAVLVTGGGPSDRNWWSPLLSQLALQAADLPAGK